MQAKPALFFVVISVIGGQIFECAKGAQPEFAQPLKNVSVPVGRDAVFSCVVSHLGGYRENWTRLQVGWVKADTKAIQAIHTHVITHNARVSVTHTDQNTWNLHIRKVQEEDRGPYMCQINTDPMRSQIGYLEVTVPPQIVDEESSSDIMVPEGSAAILVCRASGYPKPKVTWQREDQKPIVLRTNNTAKPKIKKMTFEGEVLNLTHITRSDMGPYLCMANNAVPPIVSKRIMVEVHFAPVVHVPDQLIGIPKGSTALLKCNVEASPKSIQYWTRDDGTMLINDEEYLISEKLTNYYVTHMTLKIPNFDPHHVGTYYCNAKNSIGEVSGHITVNEFIRQTEPPTVYEDISISSDFENEIYPSEKDLTNHIPYDPYVWGNGNPSQPNRGNSKGHRNKNKNNSPQYSPKLPTARPTKNPLWSWQPPSSSSSDRYGINPLILGVFTLCLHFNHIGESSL
ncbi:UNVERIFIED_CONTAM: hypothetical protein RMT77_011402 [Armadillidium vulgare]